MKLRWKKFNILEYKLRKEAVMLKNLILTIYRRSSYREKVAGYLVVEYERSPAFKGLFLSEDSMRKS